MTKEVLLSGQSRDGLYVFSESSTTSLPQAFSSTCLSTSADVWHRRLGHPSPRILHLLVKNKKVSCTSTQINFHCPACPLSYPLESSTSRRPFLVAGIDVGVFVW
jgi:hypothetical protein